MTFSFLLINYIPVKFVQILHKSFIKILLQFLVCVKSNRPPAVIFHALFLFRFGIHASAVILPVQSILGGQFHRSLIAVLFLEIRRQVLHMTDVSQFLADFIELPGIFERTDGECRRKIIVTALHGQFCRLKKPQTVAAKAPLSALRLLFKSFRHRIEPFRLIRPHFQPDWMHRWKPFNQALLLLHPLFILLCRRNIGIVIIHCDFKIPGQILQNIAAARGTATMQQEPGNPTLMFIARYNLFQFMLIIPSVHIISPDCFIQMFTGNHGYACCGPDF